MSSRYQASRCSAESQKYVEAVLVFLADDDKNMDVLEVGAGTGRITKRLVGRSRSLTCIDFSPEMIARNRESLGLQANKVTFLEQFAQDYRPKQAHDVVVCSLVLIHNVDDDAYDRLVQMMCASADTIFLFEHVDDPGMPHLHTRRRSEQELVTAFSDYEEARRHEYFLFEDLILFLKLVRRRAGTPPPSKKIPTVLGNAKGPRQRSKTKPRNYRYDAFISYRHQDPDRTIVRSLLTDLESAGYKVAIDERDFRANAIFLQEMERCIEESRFTLVVASPRYFKSGNTLEEAIICKVLDMDEQRRRLIPLIIGKVKMPTWLYNIVGIDFTVTNPLVKPIERLMATLGDALL